MYYIWMTLTKYTDKLDSNDFDTYCIIDVLVIIDIGDYTDIYYIVV